MDRKKKIRFTILLLTVNIVFIALASIYAYLVARAGGEGIVSCQFKHLFKLYCPGCGGSRSLVHLFNFDIISATLAYPPMPVLLFFYLIINLRCALVISSGDIFYLKSFKSWTLIFIPVAILISFVIRNLLLIFYGVDFLGDLTPSFMFL